MKLLLLAAAKPLAGLFAAGGFFYALPVQNFELGEAGGIIGGDVGPDQIEIRPAQEWARDIPAPPAEPPEAEEKPEEE